MLRISLLCITFLVALNGCATYRNNDLERMQTLPQNYSQFDVRIAWEVKAVDNSTIIDGIIKNIRYYEMDELEIWVWSLDDHGKEIYRSSAFVYKLKENETAPFTVKLPIAAPGTKLQFLYRYIGNDGGSEANGAVRWSQSFESVVP